MATGVLGTAISRVEFGMSCLPLIGEIHSAFQIFENMGFLAENLKDFPSYLSRPPRKLSSNEILLLTSEVKVYALSGIISALLSTAVTIAMLASGIFAEALGLAMISGFLLFSFVASLIQCTGYRNRLMLQSPAS